MCEETVKARKGPSERSQRQNNALGVERAEQFWFTWAASQEVKFTV